MIITDKSSRNIAVVTVVAFVIVMAFMLSNVWAGTYTKKVPIGYGVVDADSVRVELWELGENSKVDSDELSSYPDTLEYTLDSATAYEIRIFESWYASDEMESPTYVVIPALDVKADVSALATSANQTLIIDTVNGMMDTLQLQDGWVAHQTTTDSLYDSLLIVLDSLEALESWVAHQTTSDSLYDSLLIVMDSLEALESWVAKEASLFDPGTTPVTPTDTTAPGDTLAVKKDSLIFQGAAASPSATADAGWDELQSGHTDAGSFGKYLDVEVSSVAGCLGSGSDTLIYYTVDTGNDVRVEGVQVSMYTIGGGQVGGPQLTDANGYNLWALNSGDTLLPVVYGPHQYIWELDTLVFTGQTADSAMGYKIDDPPAAATAPYVAAYFDGGAGFVDSATGLMITRTNVIYYCQIVGAQAFADASWGIVPQMQVKRPDANGRVTFLVVANLFLTPPTNYYRFWYEARDQRTRVRRTIRNFIVDSLPDPVNILETTETFPGNY